MTDKTCSNCIYWVKEDAECGNYRCCQGFEFWADTEPKEDCKSSTLQMSASEEQQVWTTEEIFETYGVNEKWIKSEEHERQIKQIIDCWEANTSSLKEELKEQLDHMLNEIRAKDEQIIKERQQAQEIHENYCALKERFAELEKQLKQADDIILDVINQSCGSDIIVKECDSSDQIIDNQCTSAYEDACNYLAKKELLMKVNDRIYKIKETTQ
jgi:nucleotidyltransferase/DNA polymerase involved in DNA repair